MSSSSSAESQNPPFLLADRRFALSCPDDVFSPQEKEDAKKFLLETIEANDMLHFYLSLVDQFKFEKDADLAHRMRERNNQKVEQLKARIKDAEENLGESEVREALLAEADQYSKTLDKDNSVSAYRVTLEKTVGLGEKLDIVFTIIRIGFFWNDHDLIERNIEKAKSLIEQGGDWDRRNRLKVYEGLHFLTVRKFSEAASLFLEGLATFTSEELFPYNTFIFHTALVSIVSLDRVKLKEKVIDAPEVLGALNDLGKLGDLLNSLYNSNYSLFFVALADITDKISVDRYFAAHARYFCREMRIVAYGQLLDSYRSVRLDSMAKDFGLSVEFLDRELSRFIAAGRLHCKIDKVGGIVETTRPDSKNAQYQAVIKQGDILLNRVSKLSRIINL